MKIIERNEKVVKICFGLKRVMKTSLAEGG